MASKLHALVDRLIDRAQIERACYDRKRDPWNHIGERVTQLSTEERQLLSELKSEDLHVREDALLTIGNFPTKLGYRGRLSRLLEKK